LWRFQLRVDLLLSANGAAVNLHSKALQRVLLDDHGEVSLINPAQLQPLSLLGRLQLAFSIPELPFPANLVADPMQVDSAWKNLHSFHAGLTLYCLRHGPY
jgi:hypothetical protein